MGGAVSQTGFELTGSYQIKLPNTDMFSFGLCLQGTQFGFDSSNLNVWDQDDPALSGGMETSFGFDASAGFLVYGDDYSMGLAVSNLFQDEFKELNFLVDTSDNKSIRHYRLTGSYIYDFSGELAVQGSGMIRLTEVTPIQLDVYARGIYTHRRSGSQYWGGLGLRLEDAVNISLGMIFANVGVGYSYDFTTSGNLLGRHSHEVNLTYLLPNRKYGKGYRRVLDRSRLVK
jgi:type IX secretion system PorP/SprF family membrane protein